MAGGGFEERAGGEVVEGAWVGGRGADYIMLEVSLSSLINSCALCSVRLRAHHSLGGKFEMLGLAGQTFCYLFL